MGQNQVRRNKKSDLLIKGKQVCLREIKLLDVNKNYFNWLKDPEVAQYLESRFEKWSFKRLKDYVKKIINDNDYLFLAIILKNNNKHIGNIKLGPINRFHNSADVGIMIGEKSLWRKGFATEAIKLIINFAFNKLRLHKLTAQGYRNNYGSIKAFKKSGFSVEGVRKKHFFFNGKYIDGVLLGIVRK